MNLAPILERLPLDELQQARDEWDSNQRLRLGLLAIWALFLLYLALVLSDEATAARGELSEMNQRLERLQSIHAQQYWLERAEQGEAALAELQSSFPEVSSSGRAEAQVRSMVEAAIKRTGNRKLRLNMQDARPLRDGQMWQVNAAVSGVVPGEVARDLLVDLETGAQHGRVQRLNLIRGNTAKKVRIDVELEYLFRAAGP